MSVRPLALLPALLVALVPAAAWAQDPPSAPDAVPPPAVEEPPQRISPLRVTWRTAVADATPALVVSGFMGAMTLPAYFLISPPGHPWRLRDGFDEAWRRALRAPTDAGRTAADVASSVLVGAGAAQLLIVDAWGFATVRSGADLALQMTWINAQALAFTALAQTVVSAGAGRERPFGESCPAIPVPGSSCASSDRYRSFFSGHTSIAFTTAGLICMHHHFVPLYDDGVGERLTCAAAVGAAAATGVLRTVADRHYLSDVLVGMGIGAVSGVGIPWLYYRTGAVQRIGARPARGEAYATVVPAPAGAAVVGSF
jgi:membrane-associated phospholipid phosphatase